VWGFSQKDRMVRAGPWDSSASSRFPYDASSSRNGEGNGSCTRKSRFPRRSNSVIHVFLKHTDGRATSVPVHAGEILGPGLLRSILRDVELSAEELIELL